ncbi:MAG TPA: glycosyltransferase family 4 protein [Polyangiales bacterium]|jgi:glycosyltransferase involved in cell wall biosynthesis|nr:glycosyltransferase family 4 protein [Polyangiales bacterium]
MRIGLLTTSFPRTLDDSAGAFVLGFARALAALGHELEVLAPEPAEHCEPLRAPGIVTRHVRYLRPRVLQRTFYGAGVPDNLRRDARAWLGAATFPFALARECAAREHGWDALVSHWALPSALVAGSAQRGRPHLAVFHSADLHLLCRIPGKAQLAERIARQASALWFVSPQHRDAFLELLPECERPATTARAFVSPMGIDAPEPALGREQSRRELALQRFSVLALSRLVPIKGLDTAIRALAGQDASLLIAGDGIEREPLARLAREVGSDVRFLGHAGPEQKRRLFAAADAFVMPSRTLSTGRSEGVPTALLEAMAHGLPAVATRSGGMPSLVEHERTGLLVPEDDPSALAAALQRVRSDGDLRLRLANAGRSSALRFAWPQLGPAAEALLRRQLDPMRELSDVRAPTSRL